MPAPQPQTYEFDRVNPNEQAWAQLAPVLWTGNRVYNFNQTNSSVNPNLALVYKSVDRGISWTQPDVANAPLVSGEFDVYYDGTNIVTFVLVPNNAGPQALVLQDFDLDAETYSAPYGAGAPVNTWDGPPKISKTADGSYIVIADTTAGGLTRRTRFAVYSAGVWTVALTDYATNIAGIYAQTERVIVDPTNNLCHVFYSDTINFYYRKIHSDGTLGAITTLNAGWNLHIGSLNKGLCFNTGFLDGTILVAPVFTRDPITGFFSLQIVSAPDVSIDPPVFSIANVDSAIGVGLGYDIGQAVAYNFGGTYSVVYFMGDQLGNLYNLVRIATLIRGTWTPQTVYDAMNDANASKNTGNNQWINCLSAAPDALGNFVFQIGLWGIFTGSALQNIGTWTTLVGTLPNQIGGAGGTQTGGIGGGFNFGQLKILRIILPDPKVCKTTAQLNRRQFQKGFTIC